MLLICECSETGLRLNISSTYWMRYVSSVDRLLWNSRQCLMQNWLDLNQYTDSVSSKPLVNRVTTLQILLLIYLLIYLHVLILIVWFCKEDSGFIPLFVYAIFGSSRQLAVGPVALVSLLVSNVLTSIVDSSDALYTELAILLAFMVGVMECILGLLRYVCFSPLLSACSWIQHVHVLMPSEIRCIVSLALPCTSHRVTKNEFHTLWWDPFCPEKNDFGVWKVL